MMVTFVAALLVTALAPVRPAAAQCTAESLYLDAVKGEMLLIDWRRGAVVETRVVSNMAEAKDLARDQPSNLLDCGDGSFACVKVREPNLTFALKEGPVGTTYVAHGHTFAIKRVIEAGWDRYYLVEFVVDGTKLHGRFLSSRSRGVVQASFGNEYSDVSEIVLASDAGFLARKVCHGTQAD